jgi:hypothetical protein
MAVSHTLLQIPYDAPVLYTDNIISLPFSYKIGKIDQQQVEQG